MSNRVHARHEGTAEGADAAPGGPSRRPAEALGVGSAVKWALGAAVVVTALHALPLLDRDVFDRLMREDSWVESVGAISFLTASIFAALSARAPVPPGHQLRRVALVGLAVAFFFAAGEEVSWGQRLFGLETPEALRAVNTQDETTLHNVEGVGRLVEVGFALLWITLAVVVPALAALSARLARLLSRASPVIPLVLGLVFLWNFVLSKVALRAFERWDGYDSKYPVVHTTTEIKETGFSILFAIAMFLVWRHRRTAEAAERFSAGAASG